MDPSPNNDSQSFVLQDPMKWDVPESFMAMANYSDDGKSNIPKQKATKVQLYANQYGLMKRIK